MSLINPYSECGILHNDVLDYLIAQNTTPTWDEYRGYAADYICTFYDHDTPAYRNVLQYDIAKSYNTVYFDSAVGYTKEDLVKLNYPWSGEQLVFLNKIMDLSNISSTYFTDIADDVLESSLLPVDQAPLLSACAIGHSSYQYWDDAITNPSNPWYDDYHSVINLLEAVGVDLMAYLMFASTALFGLTVSEEIRGEEYSEMEKDRLIRNAAIMAGLASGVAIMIQL